MPIAENLDRIREGIDSAALRAGRKPDEVTLVAVTKTVGAEAIREAIEAGVTDIGENYVQDSVAKFDEIGCAVRWHMIGHLQTNKVRAAVPVFDVIQSVDSVHLAEEIAKRSSAIGKTSQILVEVNISGEESKTGVEPDGAMELCSRVREIPGIQLIGLMGIAPFVDDQALIRASFAGLRAIWDRLPEPNRMHLSMGMTSDFEIAIEEGSTMVRIGTAIFGPRNYPR